MIEKLLKFLFLALFIFNYNFLSGEDINLSWKGKSEFQNGIIIKTNTGEPIFGEINFDLEENLSINFGKDENDLFEWISKIELDCENNIYLLDSKKCTIFKYDNQGKYLYRIGRKGAGPAEFRRPRDFFIDKKGKIYVLDNRIIHILTNSGNYKKQIKLNKYATNFFVNSKDEIIISFRSYSGKKKEIIVALFSSDLKTEKKIAAFSEGEIIRRKIGDKKVTFYVEHIYTPGLYFARMYDDKCVFSNSSNYVLIVIDKRGNTLLKIKKEEKGYPILKTEKKIICGKFAPYYEKKWGKKVLQEALQFPKYRPFFNRMIVDEKGRIYVARLKSVIKKKKKDTHITFDVFNKDGYYIYQIRVPFIPNLIRNGYLYYIDENNESEDIKVKRFKIKNWLSIKNKI